MTPMESQDKSRENQDLAKRIPHYNPLLENATNHYPNADPTRVKTNIQELKQH